MVDSMRILQTCYCSDQFILHGFGYNEHTGMDNIEDIDFDYINNLTVKCKTSSYRNTSFLSKTLKEE